MPPVSLSIPLSCCDLYPSTNYHTKKRIILVEILRLEATSHMRLSEIMTLLRFAVNVC